MPWPQMRDRILLFPDAYIGLAVPGDPHLVGQDRSAEFVGDTDGTGVGSRLGTHEAGRREAQ
jgi:hypothetical protein